MKTLKKNMRALFVAAALIGALGLVACSSSGGNGGDTTSQNDVAVNYDTTGGDTVGGDTNGGNCTAEAIAAYCAGRQCGSDRCGGTCGEGCDTAGGEVCTSTGLCCVPQCGTAVCGDDGCGGSCGTCTGGQTCEAGACVDSGCTPECNAANCETCNTATNTCQSTCTADETCDGAGNCVSAGACCIDWYGCVNDCTGDIQQCIIECDEALSDTGLAAKNAFEACRNENCMYCQSDPDPNCFADCSENQCGTELDACMADCFKGTDTCGDFVFCLNGCADGDTACVDDCYNKLSLEGYEGYEAIITCLEDNCPGGDLENCDQETLLNEGGACATTWDTCIEAAYCNPAEEQCLSCAGINSCLGGCPDDDRECFLNCYTSATTEANDQLEAIIDCLVENCPDGDLATCDQAAYLDEGGACASFWDACMAGRYCDPGTSDCLDCAGFDTCAGGCGNDDSICVENCVGATSEEEFDKYIDIITCLEENCPDGDLQNCDQNALLTGDGACAAIYTACFGEPVPACDPATATCTNCSEYLSCLGGCSAGDSACFDACEAAATADARSQLSDLYTCLYDECPDDANFETCANAALTGACSTEANACEGLMDAKASLKLRVKGLKVEAPRQVKVVLEAKPSAAKFSKLNARVSAAVRALVRK